MLNGVHMDMQYQTEYLCQNCCYSELSSGIVSMSYCMALMHWVSMVYTWPQRCSIRLNACVTKTTIYDVLRRRLFVARLVLRAASCDQCAILANGESGR